MIYENGYIQAIETEQGSFDDKGRPVFSEAVECELIPCMFRSSVNDKPPAAPKPPTPTAGIPATPTRCILSLCR